MTRSQADTLDRLLFNGGRHAITWDWAHGWVRVFKAGKLWGSIDPSGRLTHRA